MGIFGRDDKEDKNKGGPPSITQRKKKNIIQKAADKSITLNVIKGVGNFLGEATKKSNVKRRKEFITKYNTSVPPSERISMSDSAIGSAEGLASLKEAGYKTISDMSKGPENDNRNTSILSAKPTTELQKAAVKAAPAGPTIADIGNVEETEEQRLLRIKRKGRRATKLAADEDELNLSKKALLG